MKNIIIIFSLVALFFALTFGIYIAGFKYYFSSDRMIKHTKRIVRMTFQREANISKINLSPFGSFKVNAFAMAAKGGFDSGTVFSLSSISAKVNILKLFRREIVVEGVSIKGINIYLNYENGRKFNYSNFFSNVKYVFMSKSKKHGLLRKAEINSILIAGSNVELKTDYGLMKFKDMAIESESFKLDETFAGKGTFVFEWGAIKAKASAVFRYDRENKIIYFENIVSDELFLSADGKIKLLESGYVDTEYVLKIKKSSYDNIIKNILGFASDGVAADSGSNIDDDIIISYPGFTKEIKK